MTPQLLFAASPTFATPLLAAFAVDISERGVAGAQTATRLLVSDPALAAAGERFLTTGEFLGKAGQTLLLHAPAGLAAERLLLVGVGAQAKVSPEALRRAAGTAVRYAMDKGIRSLALTIEPLAVNSAEALRAIAEGVTLAGFDSDTYKSDRKDRSLTNITILAAGFDSEPQDALTAAFQQGIQAAESQNFTRALVLEPGNVLTPTELARRAAQMADEVGLSCQVHSTDFLREQKMNAFLAVAQGSAQPPALVVLRYEPEGALPQDAPVIALVGKGITFDTGGISIKPADGMEKMKYDMAGAAAMLGAMRAIALRKPAVRVLCLICSAENMPSGTAYKPGDIVTAMSGKTIEVINTDAEGRMVLADGLHFARTLGATHLIDAATLTGACVVALGKRNAGLFSNDDATCQRFQQVAGHAGESFWRLPCTDDYAEDIKSQIADIQNTGVNRWGGAITAAMFLKEFVADTPWIHLDIAGQAWIDEARPDLAKGPSGVAVRSIVDWVCSYKIA